MVTWRTVVALIGAEIEDKLSGDDYDVVAHVLDGIIDNKDMNGGSFEGWDADLGIEVYCDEDFKEREGIDPDEINWEFVKEALGIALENMVTREKAEAFESDDVEAVHVDEFFSKWVGTVGIELTETGRKRLAVGTANNAEIEFNGDSYVATWTDILGNYQESEFYPGAPDSTELGMRWAVRNPADAIIEAIEGRLENGIGHGIVLVNLEDGKIWAQGEILEEAQKEIEAIGDGSECVWTQEFGAIQIGSVVNGTAFAAYKAPLLDWAADNTEELESVGEEFGVLRCIEADREAA